MDFRKSLMISGGLHALLLGVTLVAFSAPTPHTPPSIDHIPLDLVEDISNDQQRRGERDGAREREPQARQVPVPTPRPDPDPVPNPTPRPVDPSSAPVPPPPPPPPQRVAERPPEPAPAPPPPPVPVPRPQASEQPPPDQDGLMRRIEEERRAEQQRQEQQRQEQQRQEQQRQEQQRQQAERERREREQREARERQQREARERQQREARERREREQREQQQRQAQQQPFDPQRIRDQINRQPGAAERQAQQGNQQQAALGNPRGSGQRLTQSQYALLIGMIRDQISPCWSPPASAGVGQNRVVVRIEMNMNRDGTLNGRPRVMNPNADPQFRSLSDSAVRAILRCSANGLRLPAEMYDAPNGWREIEFAFDPSQMG